jgi:hypothetical protein
MLWQQSGATACAGSAATATAKAIEVAMEKASSLSAPSDSSGEETPDLVSESDEEPGLSDDSFDGSVSAIAATSAIKPKLAPDARTRRRSRKRPRHATREIKDACANALKKATNFNDKLKSCAKALSL